MIIKDRINIMATTKTKIREYVDRVGAAILYAHLVRGPRAVAQELVVHVRVDDLVKQGVSVYTARRMLRQCADSGMVKPVKIGRSVVYKADILPYIPVGRYVDEFGYRYRMYRSRNMRALKFGARGVAESLRF